MWALKPTGTVIVFVHGFNGSPVDTWSEFEDLLPEHRHHDLIFFGYDSLRTRIDIAALALREFLKELCASPCRTANSSIADRAFHRSVFTPSKILLVGHSLGAVVARRSLVIAHSTTDDWQKRVSLLLFAPAHMGAHLATMASEVLSVFKLPISALARWQFPVLTDLDPQSQFLKDLRDRVSEAIKTGAADFLKAQLVVLAEQDHVVNVNAFSDHDAPGIPLPRSHTAVCKPSADYQRPLELLLEHA
jgi:pimeloyl-ACP methyl ester carboxylesterase